MSLSLQICNCNNKTVIPKHEDYRLRFVEQHKGIDTPYVYNIDNPYYKSTKLNQDIIVYLALIPFLEDDTFNIGDILHLNTSDFMTTYNDRKTTLEKIEFGDPRQNLFEIYIPKDTQVYFEKHSFEKNIVLPNSSMFQVINVRLVSFYGSSIISYRVHLCVNNAEPFYEEVPATAAASSIS